MGMSLADQIPDDATVLIDTNPVIYLFENHPLAAPFEPICAAIDAGRIKALVTPVTLAEVVAGPLKADKEALAERYRQALCASRGWSLREIDADIAVLAARLRIHHRLRLPDAIQAAVAVREGCYALVRHDPDFRGRTDLLVLGPDTPA
ncbi:MAG: PIN domain-containing protein [Planctomycetota bacterium]|nr:MAG: PIN domain-containing protein [Planctomycetota bacterium]